MDIQETPDTTTEPGKPASPKKLEALVIIGLAALSFAAGYALVLLALPDSEVAAASDGACAPDAEPPTGEMAATVVDTEPTEEANYGDQGNALPEVPPAPTPDGIRIDGAPLYFKCWNNGGDESKECDRLAVLEKRMNTRLYVVHECAKAHSGSTTGILSLGANLEFGENTIKFWSGPSSTLENHQKVGNCLRTKLAGMPIHGIDHRYAGYRIFFTVEFFDPDERAKAIARKRKSGREIQVVKDRVNVREEPVTGASIGRISSDSKVVLLKKNDTKEWCYIITPSNREGWMICEALGL